MTTREHIYSALGIVPDALVTHFEKAHARFRQESRSRCLPFPEALSYTQHILKLTVGDHFGLFVLNDAQDSNPFCFVARGACAGSVIHLMHDGDTRVSHRSLDSFLNAIELLSPEAVMDDLPTDSDIVFDTVSTIQDLLSSQYELDVLLPIYLPVSREIPVETKRDLAACDDFFVREAFAEWLRLFGTKSDLALAELLSADRMGQVAKPAKQALARLRRPN